MSTHRSRIHHPIPALAGANVIVTRPTDSSAVLKRRIVALGGVALSLPALSLRGTEDSAAARVALRAARSADLVVFVSPAAVRHAFELIPTLRFSRATRVCAIGAGTARALRRHGVKDALWPVSRQDSEGLLALPEFAEVRGRRIALVGAPGGRDLLHRELNARGAITAQIHVYRRVQARLNRRHFGALEHAAAPLLTLLSSTEALTHLRGQLPKPLFATLTCGEAVVSSLRLATAARAAGWQRVHIAASAGTTDMLDAAVSALAQHRL